jgi:hypothetical protein
VPLSAREADSTLKNKGFQRVDRDHQFYYLHVNGKKTHIRTMISHGEREISDPNCGSMAREMKITGPEFREFMSCTLQHEQYVEKLIERGEKLPPPESSSVAKNPPSKKR